MLFIAQSLWRLESGGHLAVRNVNNSLSGHMTSTFQPTNTLDGSLEHGLCPERVWLDNN